MSELSILKLCNEDENKENFTRDMTELEDKIFKLTQLKTILYKKNNSFHLSDGRTI